MTQAPRNDLLKALDGVIDPQSGRSVVLQDMIQGLVLKDGRVRFVLEVSPLYGAEAEPLLKACEDAVRPLPGVLSVTAVLTAHVESGAPRSPHAHGDHQHAPVKQAGIPGVGAIIAVASGKGGVGKSTVAVNLALGLQTLGFKVGLLDADVYGPSVPRLLGITEKPVMDGDKLAPIVKLGLKTVSIGFLVDEDTPIIWRGPMVQSTLTQLMNDVAWAPLDILVIDMPPGTGDAQLTIAQQVPLKGAIIVSTPQDIALIDARKGLAMFRKTQVPVLGIVENMSTFVCPNCGHESHIFGHGGARETAKALGTPFLGEIPLVTTIRETSDAGTPIVAAAPNSAEAKAFLLIAKEVAAKIEAPQRPAPKFVME